MLICQSNSSSLFITTQDKKVTWRGVSHFKEGANFVCLNSYLLVLLKASNGFLNRQFFWPHNDVYLWGMMIVR